jgi:TolB-like protein/DNA-binding winged helix-turn-helix (wHTH) protein/Tfp pilus assembly protein PilF
MSLETKHLYEFGPFRIDSAERVLLRDGRLVHLTGKAFDVLLALAERSGHIVERDELIEKVWPDCFVEEGNLTVTISMLRKVLEAGENGNLYIETVPRRGYRFTAEVRDIPINGAKQTLLKEAGSEVVANEDELTVTTDGGAAKGQERRLKAAGPGRKTALLVAAVLVIGTLAGLLLFRRGERTAAEIKSLAVLPLRNLSNDPEQDYFAEGMTEALINHLAKIGALRVISRTSAMHYKGTAKRLTEIAQDLNVDAIAEGSVLRSGDRVRITVQLIHAPTEQSLWANSYERDLRDVLDLQKEMAQTIAQEIQIKVTPAEQARLARARPVKREAYLNYLKGRHHWNKRAPESVDRAIEHFQSAIDEDPAYAPAYAGLSDCYALQGTVGIGTKSPRETRPLAAASARKALQIDGELAEAHTALAVIHHYEWEWAEAERGFQRALELNPGYPHAHYRYSSYLASRGRLEEAVVEARRAEELDPLSVTMKWNVAYILNFARRHDEAIQQLQSTLELDPNYAFAHSTLGVSYIYKSMFAEAIASLEKAAVLSKSPLFVGRLASAYAMSGNTVQARKLLRELMDLQKQRYVSPAAIAQLYIGLGEKDRAFEWLEKAYQERSNFMANLGVSPVVDPLRSDPRFQDLLRRIGLEK